MEQYVPRRRRSWTPLTQMDSVIHLSKRHRSDMLLDLSGLTQKWRVKDRASINKESDFYRGADGLFIQHTRVHLRESRKRPKEKGKDPHQLREGGKHCGNGKSGTGACYTNSNFVEDYDHGDNTVERADTYQAHSDSSNFGGDGREEVLGCAVYEKIDTFSPYVALGEVSTFEATRPDALGPPADRQDNDFDSEVSVQLERAKERVYLPFGEERD